MLTAIAIELERDEAERRRHVPGQDGADGRGSDGVPGTGHGVQAGAGADGSGASPANGTAVGRGNIGQAPGNISGASPANGSVDSANGSGASSGSSEASPAAGYGVTPANGSSADPGTGGGASPDNGSASPDNGSASPDNDGASSDNDGASPDNRTGASPVNGPPWGRDAAWPVTPVQPGDTPRGEPADLGRSAAEDATMAREPQSAAERGEAADAGDAAGAPAGAAPWPAVPLPRRAPGANGAPPPPAELRREYLPPAMLGRRLDPEAHTEPLPRISGAGTGPGGPAATASGRPAPSLFTPTAPATAPPAAATPAGSPAQPGPPASGPSTATAPGSPAEPVPPGTPSASTVAAASAPTMPVGSAALAAALAPTMPAGSAALAAAARLAPPAGPAQTAADLAQPADLAAAPTAPAGHAGPVPVTLPAPMPAAPTSAQSRPPAAPPPAPSFPAPSGYGWAADPGGTRPGNGRGAGTAVPLPAALPATKRPRRSGRSYRIAGVILAVVALVAAGVIALVLSGRATPGQGTGQGSHARGAGAAVRTRAAAWVAGQVSRTAVVACDPVMCQALRSHGVLASRLYQLGSQTTSPLRSEIIVATAAVRAQFGNVLGAVYAPAVLASFGFGPDRIDIRQTAQHGAAAYRAMLRSDLANRIASGAQLLHSGRIAAAPIARRELATGDVDGRLLLAIAQMAAAHPMFIVDFGIPAPGAGPDIPLRQADLAEDAHPHHHVGHAGVAYVRSMVSFLHAQHGQFRPARVQTVHMAGGLTVLRIQFTAPSPLGLLGPHA